MIYVTRDGQQMGPYSPVEAQRLVATGALRPTDWAWQDGMADWMPLSQLLGSTSAAQVPGFRGAPAERPIAVWIISIFYFICTPFALIGIFVTPLLLAHNPAVSERQRHLLAASHDPLHIGLQLINLALVLAWAIQLFRLKRSAMIIYGVVMVWSVVSIILQFTTGSLANTLSSGGTPVMIGAIIGVGIGMIINLALLWYTWHLYRKGTLH